MGGIWRARMTWIPESEGGRKRKFGGLTYRAQGYYEEFDPERNRRAFCDTAFYFDGPAATGVRDMCWVTLPSDYLPSTLLYKGRIIDIYEGSTMVARCEILGAGNDFIGVTADDD